MKFISYGRQYVDTKDVRSLSRTLKKEKITTGEEVEKFEKKLNKFLGCKYSLTCNSGTSAIFLALQAINLKKNDKIIMPAINFISSYNVAKLFGAKIYLADINNFTGQMTPENVIECCKKFKLKKIKALILMYNGGDPDNAENFIKLKKKLKCYIIEDACHAFGAEYKKGGKNYKIGSCKHSDISTFSFHALKTITTGEGGLVTTNKNVVYSKIKKLRSLGIKRKKNHWDYDVENTGLNFRLTDFQCAFGRSQLNKIRKFLTYRKNIYLRYKNSFKNEKDIYIFEQKTKYKSSNHLFIIYFKNFNKLLKDKFIKYMLSKKIIVQFHYIPIYKFKLFSSNNVLKNSEKFYNAAVSLPIYYNLKIKEQNHIINCVKSFLSSLKGFN